MHYMVEEHFIKLFNVIVTFLSVILKYIIIYILGKCYQSWSSWIAKYLQADTEIFETHFEQL